jgi:predicted DNA-binding transcriptional regulator YafY
MARSSQVERVHRINVAHQLLRDEMAFAEVAEVLSERFAVGKRQAYRYLREACQASAPLDSPEPKDVFTVKLPVTLIEQLRSHPRLPGQSLSNFVCRALERALEKQSPPQRGHSR